MGRFRQWGQEGQAPVAADVYEKEIQVKDYLLQKRQEGANSLSLGLVM